MQEMEMEMEMEVELEMKRNECVGIIDTKRSKYGCLVVF